MDWVMFFQIFFKIQYFKQYNSSLDTKCVNKKIPPKIV